jgi:uncharacterized protein (AIM24 family)
MEHEVLYRPSYSLLKISLEHGEAISAEAGAMVSMSSGTRRVGLVDSSNSEVTMILRRTI